MGALSSQNLYLMSLSLKSFKCVSLDVTAFSWKYIGYSIL